MPEDDEASRAGATAEAGYFIETTRPGIGKGLREFGVVLNESPLTNSLRSRHEALYAEAQRKVGSTKTQSIQPETILDPTVIPIFTIPARTDDKVVIELIERLDGDAQFGSLATLTFKGPEWVLIFPVA